MKTSAGESDTAPRLALAAQTRFVSAVPREDDTLHNMLEGDGSTRQSRVEKRAKNSFHHPRPFSAPIPPNDKEGKVTKHDFMLKINRRFMTPAHDRVGSLRSGSSPLAHYDDRNYFASYFGANSDTRIYRTPVGSSNFYSKEPSTASYDNYRRRASCTPAATVWHSAAVDYPTLPRGSERKSSLRRQRNLPAQPNKSKLRVSFDESSKTRDVKDNETERTAEIPRTSEPSFSQRHYRRNRSQSMPHSQPILNNHPGQTVSRLKSEERTRNQTRSPGLMDSTTPNRRLFTSGYIDAKKRSLSLRNQKNSARECLEPKTVFEITPIKRNNEKQTITALTSEQLVLRSSVEKVQRWMGKLPRHFSTIHHILPPVQHDY